MFVEFNKMPSFFVLIFKKFIRHTRLKTETKTKIWNNKTVKNKISIEHFLLYWFHFCNGTINLYLLWNEFILEIYFPKFILLLYSQYNFTVDNSVIILLTWLFISRFIYYSFFGCVSMCDFILFYVWCDLVFELLKSYICEFKICQ